MSGAGADAAVRRTLREALAGGGAHVDLDTALADLPASARGVRPPGAPHAIWELVEHLRIAQEDLVAYTTSADAPSPPWPEGYWPVPRDPVRDATWTASVEGLEAGIAAMRAWVDDPSFDLTAEIAWSDELPGGGRRTPLRQVLVACDHLGYHLGQIVAVRRALGLW